MLVHQLRARVHRSPSAPATDVRQVVAVLSAMTVRYRSAVLAAMRPRVNSRSTRARPASPMRPLRCSSLASRSIGHCECFRVAGLDDEPGLAIAVDPGHARTHVRADDRLAARHRLDLDDAESLRVCHRRQDEDVTCMKMRDDFGVGYRAEELHTIGHAATAGVGFEALRAAGRHRRSRRVPVTRAMARSSTSTPLYGTSRPINSIRGPGVPETSCATRRAISGVAVEPTAIDAERDDNALVADEAEAPPHEPQDSATTRRCARRARARAGGTAGRAAGTSIAAAALRCETTPPAAPAAA